MPARGRPASKNPRRRRIETRINRTTASELKFLCKETGLSITAVIDKAIHLLSLLVSDSRTRDDALYALDSIYADEKRVQAQWDSLINVLSDVKYRFSDIDEAKLEFIRIEGEFDSYEETLTALVTQEYLKIESRYSAAEMEAWNKYMRGEFAEPNDAGILEDFEKNNF